MYKFRRYNPVVFINEFGVASFNLSLNGLGIYMKSEEILEIVDKYEREILSLKTEVEALKDDLELAAEYD